MLYCIFWYVLVTLIIQHAKRMLYTALLLVWLYRVFPHYLINGKIFGKMLLIAKCVFWLFLQHSVWNISYCKRNSASYYSDCTSVFSCSAVIHVIVQWNWNFLFRFSKEYSNKRFCENPFSGRRADRRTIMANLIVAFRE